jgi:hypothetical protein
MLTISSINSKSVMTSIAITKPMPSRLDYRIFLTFVLTCNLKVLKQEKIMEQKTLTVQLLDLC